MTTLNFNNVTQAEATRVLYSATVPVEHSFEDLLRPTYWVHASNRMQAMDVVEAFSEDHRFWARFLVLDVVKDVSVELKLLEHVDLDPELKTLGKPREGDAIVRWDKAERRYRLVHEGVTQPARYRKRSEALVASRAMRPSAPPPPQQVAASG